MEDNSLENLDKETQQQIQEMQILEQNFQHLLMQKQAFSMELNEISIALEEIKKAKGDIFKVVANQIIIKSDKEELEKELNSKTELINLRLKNVDNQEKEFSEKLESLRENILEKISPNRPKQDN